MEMKENHKEHHSPSEKMDTHEPVKLFERKLEIKK